MSRDPAANALLQKVGKRIAAAAGNDLKDAQWEFVVFESKEANAFCLPGGKIGAPGNASQRSASCVAPQTGRRDVRISGARGRERRGCDELFSPA